MVIFALAAGREPAGITTLPKKGSGIDLRGRLCFGKEEKEMN